MEITLNTKIYDLLKEYPFMEDKLIEINPKYKKLKNPILKRTLTKIASIKQAALVGGMDPVDLLNRIRKELNQPPLKVKEAKTESKPEKIPDWVNLKPKVEIDGNKILDEGKNPLAEINKLLKKLEKDDIVLLKTDFFPSPLIDELKKRGYEIFNKSEDKIYLTFIKK